MRTLELTLPSHWACALMYGDETGDAESDNAIDAITRDALAQYETFHCVDVQDSGEFMRWHDAHDVFPYASDCARFIFDVTKAKKG